MLSGGSAAQWKSHRSVHPPVAELRVNEFQPCLGGISCLSVCACRTSVEELLPSQQKISELRFLHSYASGGCNFSF